VANMKLHLLKKLQLKKVKKMSALDQFVLALAAGAALIILYFAGTLVLQNLPQDPVARYLPAEETLVYLEVNDLKFPGVLQTKTAETQSMLAETVGQTFGVDLKDILTSWGHDHLAYALLKDAEGRNHPLLLIEAKSKRSALNYFKSLLLPNEELLETNAPKTIYTYAQGQSFSFTFVDKYAAIAPDEKALQLLTKDREMDLLDDETYRKTINNLPRNKWLLAYLNLRKLSFGENVAVNNIVEPLKHAVHHLAIAVRKDQEGFHFNTFLNLNKNLLSLDRGGSKTKFAYELTNYIVDDDVALYIGGANLEAEWQNTLETISNMNPAYGIILEGIIRAQANDIFGGQVDLRNDLYPLFAGEYALAIGKGKLGKNISLILAHEDRSFAEKKLEKLSGGFKFLAAKFAPKIKEVELPDGTISRELVPDNNKVEESEEKVGGYDVYCTEVTGTAAGFCYTVTNEIIIMTNSKETILKTIKLDENQPLSENASFRKALSNLSKINDEVTYISFESFTEIFAANQYVQALTPLLSGLDSASWVKHYFTDGVSTEGYILVK
jgi:hypothetical protein